jgi:flavin-binding protein dodecin
MVHRIVSARASFEHEISDARLAARQEHPASCQKENGRTSMAESVYKVIELIGTSKESWEKAATAAVSRAGKSLRELRVAEVVQLDLQLDAKGKVEAYRAKLKVSFKFEGS